MATIPEIISRWVDNDGAAIPFSRLYSYSARSSVPKALYSDVECTIPLANPLVSDASGKFPQFFATSGRYKFALKTAGDVLIDTRDDIEASGNGSVGTVTSVQVTLGAALGAAQHVTTPPVTSSGDINMEFLPQSARYVLIGPTSGTGLPTFRALEVGDIPDLSGRYLPLAGGVMDATATVQFRSAVTTPTSVIDIDPASIVLRNNDYTHRTQLDQYRILFSVNGSTAAFEPSQFNLTNSLTSILGSVGGSAGMDIAVTSGGGDATCVTRRVGFATTQNATTVFSTTSNAVTAADFQLSSQTTCFVGQDFDIRNSKRLLIGGVEAISSARVGSFTGFSSTGGGTITGGKFTVAAATATYASLNIPTRSAAVTSPVAGDIQNDGTFFLFQNGGQFTGDIVRNGAAGTSRILRFRTNGLDRWVINCSAAAESGSNSGSDLGILACDDAGNPIDTPFSMGRAAGSTFSVNRPLSTSSTFTATSWIKSAGRQSAFIARTTAYTALATDEVIGISGTTIFNVLLPATAVVGTCYTIKRTDANTTAHTVTAGGTTTIDGATTFTFSTAWQVLRVIATATNAYSVI